MRADGSSFPPSLLFFLLSIMKPEGNPYWCTFLALRIKDGTNIDHQKKKRDTEKTKRNKEK